MNHPSNTGCIAKYLAVYCQNLHIALPKFWQGNDQGKGFFTRAFALACPGVVPPLPKRVPTVPCEPCECAGRKGLLVHLIRTCYTCRIVILMFPERSLTYSMLT